MGPFRIILSQGNRSTLLGITLADSATHAVARLLIPSKFE